MNAMLTEPVLVGRRYGEWSCIGFQEVGFSLFGTLGPCLGQGPKSVPEPKIKLESGNRIKNQIDQFELKPEDPGFKNNLDIINPI